MTELYYWRIKCLTDNKFEYVWAETKPTTCPMNVNHAIDESKTTIVNKVAQNVFKLQEENIPTGGHFRTMTKDFTNIGANQTMVKDFTWDTNIAIYSVSFITKDIHEGDNLEVIIAPETVVGSLTSDINVGVTVITVSSTVIDNVDVGYTLVLDDGVNKDDLGEVLSIDNVNNTVTVKNPTTYAFNMSSPTYVKTHTYMIRDYTIGPAWEYVIGESKIGGTFVPTGTVIRVRYINNNSNIKNIYFQLEITY